MLIKAFQANFELFPICAIYLHEIFVSAISHAFSTMHYGSISSIKDLKCLNLYKGLVFAQF